MQCRKTSLHPNDLISFTIQDSDNDRNLWMEQIAKEKSHVLQQYVHGVMSREESCRITRNNTVAVRVVHVKICRWF